MRTSPPPCASGWVRAPIPAHPLSLMGVVELLLVGVVCYVLGLVSGALVIPWLVDRGLFPVGRHDPRER